VGAGHAIRARDTLIWILVQILVQRFWRGHLVLVRPERVTEQHRPGWRQVWQYRVRTRGGRLRLSSEVRELIVTMGRENPAWGSERIRGELRKLGIAGRTVADRLGEQPRDQASQGA
jgi:putative transposase